MPRIGNANNSTVNTRTLGTNSSQSAPQQTTNSTHGAGSSAGNITVITAPRSPGTQVARNIDFSSLIQHSNDSGANPLPETPVARLSLEVGINNYRSLELKGFNEQRPEILAEVSFNPVFIEQTADELTPTGKLLDVQLSSRKIKADNVNKLVNELKLDSNAAKIIANIEQNISQIENDADNEIRFLQSSVERLSAAKRSLSVKSNAEFIKADIITRDQSASNIDSIRDVVVNILGFSNDGYDSFTDTKILCQLLNDLRYMLMTHVPSIDKSQRSTDTDPYGIILPKSTPGSLNISAFKSNTSADITNILNVSSTRNVGAAFNAIADPIERMRLIFTIIAKELRVSAGFGVKQVRDSIINAFKLTDNQINESVFESIIGTSGHTIFDDITGVDGSFLNLLNINTSAGKVLPFEKNPLKQNVNTYIAGHNFYVDSIVKGIKKLDIEPYENYSKTFSNDSNALSVIVEGCLDVDVINDSSNGLDVSNVVDSFIGSIKSTLDAIPSISALHDSQHNSTTSNTYDVFMPALFAAAADDETLKHMLVLYVLYIGISAAYEPGVDKTIFNTIVESTDLNTGTGLTRSQDPLAGVKKAIADIFTTSTNRFSDNIANVLRNNLDVDSLIGVGTSISQATRDFRLNALDVLSAAIAAQLNSLNNNFTISRNSLGTDNVEIISSDAVFTQLSTLANGSSTFLPKLMISVINQFDAIARTIVANGHANIPDYFSTNKPGLTRFSSIGAHTIIQLFIELYVNFFKSYSVCTFRNVTSSVSQSGLNVNQFTIQRHETLLGDIKDALHQLQPVDGIRVLRRHAIFLDDATQQRGTLIQSIIDTFNSIKRRGDNDDDAVRKITNVIIAIGNSLSSESRSIERFFDQNGQNKVSIATVVESIDSDDKLAALDIAQVFLMRNELDENIALRAASANGQNTAPITPFIDESVLPASVENALFLYMKEKELLSPEADNKSILSIGLPSGFMSSLQSISESSTLIRLNVYMRDLLFEDVVFKPKQFLFETSRFVGASDFSNASEQTFGDLITNSVVTRLFNLDGLLTTNDSIANEGIYRSLSDNDKANLVKNHVTSYLLKLYMKLLTGIDMSESRYFINDAISEIRVNEDDRKTFIQLLLDRVSGFANRKLTFDELKNTSIDVSNLLDRINSDKMLISTIDPVKTVIDGASRAVNIELSNDLMTFLNVYSSNSVLFGVNTRRQTVVSPKLFERIFNVIVDPDDFEVDINTTMSSTTGKSLLASKFMNNILSTRSVQNQFAFSGQAGSTPSVFFDSIARRQYGNMSLRQFFVTVERVDVIDNVQEIVRLTRGNFELNSNDLTSNVRNFRQSVNTPVQSVSTGESISNHGGTISWRNIL